MSVAVEWKLSLRDDVRLSEAELAANLGAHAAAILAEDPLYGALVVHSDQPPVDFEVGDIQEALILNVCLRPVADLLAGRSVAVSYADWYGYFRMDPEARDVRVSGDGVPDVKLPFRDLLVAFFYAADRYAAFLARLGLPKERVDLVADEVASSRQLLQAAQIL